MKNKEKSIIVRLSGYAAKQKVKLIFGLLFTVLGSGLALVSPILIGKAIDTITVTEVQTIVDMNLIFRYAFITGALISLSGVFTWSANILLSRMSFHIVRDIRKELFSKLLSLPLSNIDTKSRGDLMARMSAFGENLSEGIYQGVMQLSSGIITLAVTMICMFFLNWIVALVVIALTPVSAVVSYFLAKRNRLAFKRQSELMGALSGTAEEYIAGNRLVHAYGRKENCMEDFEGINSQLFASGLASQFAGAMVNPISRIVNNIIYAVVAITGSLITAAYLTGSGTVVMTIGALSAFLSYATQFAKPFNEITSVTAELQTATAAGRKIFEIIDNADEDAGGDTELSHPAGRIVFENGAFSYGDTPFIEDLSFAIEEGKKVAVVGSTGSGKTTVINLIMRFYDLTGGKCMFGGKDIETFSRKSVRKSFGMVLQDTWLFEGTIKENIAYGKDDATDEEIAAAAEAAKLDGFINTLPLGYDTLITGDAEQLSEGQKQLITIARIFLASPDMLILDEATASVDAMTERAVQQAFAKILDGKTTITVAHRLSTIKNYDLILVMNKGKIIQRGTHEELIKEGGYYLEMVEAAGMSK